MAKRPPKPKGTAKAHPAKKVSPPGQQASRKGLVGAKPVQPVRGGALSLPNDEPLLAGDFIEFIDSPQKRLFLQSYAQGPPRIGRACRAAGITPATSWNWRVSNPDPKFIEAFELAHKLAIERAEGELWRRGIEGYETPVYHQGQLVGTEREFDTTAAIFMLKAAKPDVFREKFDHRHSGPDGGPVQHAVALAILAPNERRARMKELAEVIEGSVVEGTTETVATAKAETPAEAYAREVAARVKGNGHTGNGQGGS